jgi:uncharacterized membrane protein
MESKAKAFGHAIHPIMIVFPLGLLATAVIFDVLYLVTLNQTFSTVSWWMIAAGLIGGLLAAVFGLIDFLNIPDGTRAKRIGRIHAIVNVAAMVLFALSLYLRWDTPQTPPTTALLFSFAGVAVAMLGGWFGGELVERLGVGVSPDANLNAPNSLTSDRTNGTEGVETRWQKQRQVTHH